MDYRDSQLADIQKYIDDGLALIVTATPTETIAMHERIQPIPEYGAILRIYEGEYTYYLGLFGRYPIIHVQCGMGSISRDSSIMTVSAAINTMSPKFVLMVGIAFGIDPKSQKIGDVLISECVIPYNPSRVGADETVQRGPIVPASKLLLNRLKSIMSWEYVLSNNDKSKLIYTHILSGEELIDNKERRDQLSNLYKTAKGGEMECAGLYAACSEKVDWILIKGICDFADGNKGENKATNQKEAIDAAISICFELFNLKFAFNELGLNSHSDQKVSCLTNEKAKSDVLFDIYDKDKEQYYIERENDRVFCTNLKHYNIWVHGVSGCGKTNLILRSLISNGHNFTIVNLASCVGLDVNNIFNEILCDLLHAVSGKREEIPLASFKITSEKILELLKTNYANTEMILYIEEIPISNDGQFDQFVEMLFALIISKLSISELSKIQIILSSIASPLQYLKSHQKKVHEHLKFFELGYWDKPDSQRLIEMICQHFGSLVEKEVEEKLFALSKGSPRFIKKYFRGVLFCNIVDVGPQLSLLDEIQRDLGDF